MALKWSDRLSIKNWMVGFTLLFSVAVFSQPTISNFSPNYGTVGSLVTITGTNLSNPTAITIGGVSAIPISNNGSSLVALVMPGASTGLLSVSTGGGTANSTGNFIVISSAVPSIQQGSKLIGSGAVGGAQQGFSVALSADGSTAIVGGFFDDNNIGAAWVYTRNGNSWTQQGTKLVGVGYVGSDIRQGVSVSLSADGNTALVGGYRDNNLVGAVWVYTRNAGIWTQQGNKLVGSDVAGTSRFGRSVMLSPDGNTAVIGGWGDNNDQGAAWVFTRSAGVWTQQGNKLLGTGKIGNAEQGVNVAISADGNTIITGGWADNNYSGAAWVFVRSGNDWIQQGSKLLGSGAIGNASQGYSVALSADGNTAIIGGFGDNSNKGAAWVFTRSGNVWTQQGSKLVGSGAIGSSYQGYSVSLSVDGNTAIVGGNGDDGNTGASWIFTRSGNTWTETGSKIIGTGAVGSARQGRGVAFSLDGRTAIAGGDGDNSLNGAAWIFSSPVPAPTITSFSPAVATTGTIISINGTDFAGTSAITLGGSSVSSFTVVSNTSIVATVGTGASGAVSLTTPGGTASLGGFTFIAAPTITAFAPATAAAGAMINITGTNFNGTFALTLGGATVSSFTVVSSTTIVAIVGTGASGAVSLTTPGGTASLAGFTFIPPPTITSFTATSGPIGTLVTISGNNLSNPSNIMIAGVPAIPISNKGSSLVAMVMPGATIGTVSVTTGGGTATGVGNFSVTATLVPNRQQGNKLVGTGNSGNAYQGISVALSADGNTAIVGGIYDNSNVGAAWIFTRSGGAWVQQGSKLVGTGAVGASQQGYSVAISADGNTAIVGGYTDNSNEGAVWIFTRNAGVWTQQGTKLVGTGATGNAWQGSSVAISADGNTASVGGYNDGGNKGAVWIFTRNAGVWTQQGSKLVGSDATGNAWQGWAVAMSADGNTVMVGGFRDNGNAGASWVFTRSGGSWTQQGTKLVGTDAAGNANQGISVSLSADGNTAIVGGISDNANVGASWIFTRSAGIWTQQGSKLIGSDAVGNSYQGYGVSISADGNTAIVGGYRDNGDAGAAWMFTRNGSTWTQSGDKLVGTGANGLAWQGRSAAISADGNTAIVGGYVDNGNLGASWVYIYLPPAPTITAFTPSIAAAGTLISITGTNFTGTSIITLGGTPVTSFTVVSSTSIIAIVGTGASGAVSLTTPGGSASLAGFTFIPAPTITSFAPTTAAAGALISITGTNFNNTFALTLGGIPVTSFTVISSTSIIATVGAGASGAVSLTTPGGTASQAGFTFIPAPTITAFAPTTAAAGALISITGTNFTNTSAITLGGTPVTSFTVVSSTSIVATVGSGSSGAVSLTTPGGTASLAGFIFIPAPTITSFAPTIAAAGAIISITGTNFNNTFALTVGGTPVTSFTVVSSTSIVAIVGSGSSGAVSLTTPGGTASLTGFIFIAAPTITSFAPTTAAAGAIISITGTNFNNTFALTLGGTPVTSFTVVSSTSIVAIVGSGSSGAVSLTTPGGTASQAGFTFIPAPTITAFAPITAAAGALISITGTNFNGTSVITLGGTPVAAFTVVSSTSIVAIVGTGASGAVSLTTPGGTASQAGFTFIPAPTITSFAPTTAAAGALISITGTNFTNTSAITLGGTAVSSFTVVSSTSIVAVVGSGSSGAMSLTTPGGTASQAGFTFIPAPTITAFAPTTAAAGAIISITGTNFNYTFALTLGGTPLTSFTVVSSTSIVAIVGTGASGAVSLTSPGGTAFQAGFTFIPAPTIISFAPTTAAAGAIISITGTNFNNTFALTIGGTPVTSFTVVSSTSIVAIVGTGATGAVSLITPGGTASLNGFIFIPAPTITSFAPTTAAAGALISITGTNFNNTFALTLGGIPVTSFTVVSSTSIVAIVGAGATGEVSLTTPGGSAALAGFTFIPAPTITSFEPTSAGAGGIITITGTNFDGTSSITLGGTPVSSFTVISTTSIVAIVGTGATGAVSLTTPGGTASLAGFTFLFPPTITSFTATTGPVGTLVTITGTNLSNPLNIMIAGVPAIPISSDGSTLVAMVMPGATTGGVSVTTGGGTANGSGNFIVIPTQFPNFQQGNKFSGSGISSSAYLGWSVDVSADGNTAIIGCPVDNFLIGGALIYVRNGTSWTQQAKLVGSGNIGIAQQGTGVAISADGNTAIVGGNRDNDFVGASWIFTRTGTTWTQQGNKLVGSGAFFRPNQGWGVDMSADGNTVLIGGLGDLGGIGAAWIFTRSGGVWTQQGSKLVGTGGVGASYQGWSVALSADATTAIIGGYVDDNLKGAAWVFARSGNSWVQQGNKLVGAGAVGNAQQGWKVSISADGNTAIISGNADDNNMGAAWVFTRNSGTWLQQGNKLIGSGAIGNANQGRSVALSADGNTAVIGGTADDAGAGAAWTFTRAGDTWLQKCSKLIGSGAAGAANQGESVAISSDGNTAFIGGFTDNAGDGAAWSFIHIPPPVINNFDPTAAGSGTVITITGSNFTYTSAVSLGGTPVESFTVVASGSINARVGTGSSGMVSVISVGCEATLSGFSFIPAPIITSFSPTAAATGNLITINGSYFDNTFAITLGGTTVSSFTVVSSTTIVAIVGTGATGAVSLTTPGGTASLDGFTYIPPPTITAFTPTIAAAGALISITGTNFDNTFAITLGGTTVTAFTVISSSSIVAIVGNGATGAVSLTTPGGTASLDGFTFIPAPTITSFAPTSAGAGTLVNITGTNFNNTFAITLGGTPVAAFTVVSSTSIVAIVGTGTTGAVSLTTPGGTASLAGFTFIPAPTITAFAPTTAAAGALISITGTNFDNTYAITLGGTSVTAFTVVSSTSIVALVGSGATGAVSLTTPGGTASLDGFTFIPAPTITAFAPATAAAGAMINITGTNFDGTFALTLGGATVSSFTVVSSTTIVAIVGSGATGAVSLTTPGGTASLAGFTFIPAPTITSFAPASAGAGTLVSITGTNFNNTFAITLGGTPVAAFTVVSSTSIVAIVGTGTTGAVSLTTPGGTASLDGFTFIPAPTITAFAPATAAAGAIISITGTNFTNTSAITLGGTAVISFTVVSSTTIVAIVGIGATGAVSLTTPGGTASLSGFTFIPAPTITAFAPTTAAAGALISITGTNFNNTFAVTLGGTPVASFTVVSSTSIVARVSSGSTGAVSLTTPGGSASLAGFTFIPAPTITAFAPTTAAAGALINITGTNFNNTFAITLGGTPVTSFTVVSSTSIVAIVGAGATGAVSLTTPGGTASLSGFTFIPAPTITAFAPTTAAAGALISITGTNFNNTFALSLGGTPVTAFTVVSSTSIVAIVGNGSSGAVSLTTPGGTASLSGFTFIPAPTITNFAPASAGAGAVISITGTNFNGTSVITLGGTQVAGFTVVSSTSIVARVSSGSTGAVSLTTPGGSASLAGFTFIPAPTITAFAPTTAAAGAIISITGTNFTNTSAITLGGTLVTSFTVVSSTSIVAVVGIGATGSVSLTTPGGSASLAGFTFIPAPTITTFAPTTAAAGALISITGTNFNGTSVITLGGTPVAAFTVVSSTSIVAIVGAGSSGSISLTTPGGTASLAGFTFIPAPTITSFAPTSAGAGVLISITGTNFNGTSVITLGGTPVAAFTVVSSSSIIAIVGTGTTGAVSLTTPGGTASLAGFTFIPAPTITAFAPTTAAAGALISITGTNFDNTYAITLGGTSVTAFTVVSSTSIVALVGSGATGAVSLTTPGGNAFLSGFTFIPAPTITIFAPSSAAAGALISITGTNFNNTFAITLGGTPVTSFTVVSSTSIVAIVGTGRSGAVSLTTPGGTASLSGFTFIPAPTITSFAPTSAGAGTLINIIGTNFDNTSVITLGGTTVSSFTVVSASSIIAIVGGGSSGAVSLTTPGGSASLAGFTFIPPPTIISFAPTTAIAGTLITITGTNFIGTTQVTLGGTPVSAFTVVSSTSIVAIVGTGSSGAVSLTTPGGTASLAGFTFIPAPIITSFAPTAAAEGMAITITGNYFTGTFALTLGGTPVASFTILSSTTIVAIVGTGSSGAVSLTTPGGSASLAGFRFLLYPPNFIPDISNAFSPNGDGINDVWVVKFLEDYPNATVQIVNRYGQIVFLSTGYTQPWDGKYKGQDLPIGTYYYLINLHNGKPPVVGSITIIK